MEKGEAERVEIPHEVIGRGIRDPEFRRLFLSDPQAALAEAGHGSVQLSARQVEEIRNLDPEIIESALKVFGHITPMAG